MFIFETFFSLCSFIKRNWTSSSIGFWSPLTFYWINIPVIWEYFVDCDSIKLKQEIGKRHPPRAIWLFSSWRILYIFLDSFVLLPIISLFTKRSSPDSFITPRVSHSDQLQVIFWIVSHIDYCVVMVLEDTLLALLSIFETSLFDAVDSWKEELLLKISINSLPDSSWIFFIAFSL